MNHQLLRNSLALAVTCLAAGLNPALAEVVEVNMYGTVTGGGSSGNVSFAGRSVRVGFSYDTATVGVGGVFSGGINFLNPFIEMNGVRYVTFTDELTPLHPTTVTLLDGSPDSLAVDFDMSGYVGITDRSESLTLNFVGASNFLNGVSSLPAAASVLGAGGTGSFSLLYADDCQNYACPPVLPFFASASFTLDRMQIGAAAVPEPGSYALLGLGLLSIGAAVRRRGQH